MPFDSIPHFSPAWNIQNRASVVSQHTVSLVGTDAPTSRIRKKQPVRHHQDSVRRVVASGKVTWGGQMHWVTEMLHDGGMVCTSGFDGSLSFLHRARRFFSFSKRGRKEWGRKRRAGNARPYDVYFGAANNRRSGPMRASAPTLFSRDMKKGRTRCVRPSLYSSSFQISFAMRNTAQAFGQPQ